MKKTIVAILIGIALISLASALYGGECLSVDLGYDGNIYWDVVGNSSNLEGLTMNIFGDSSIVTICASQNYKPDNFTIVFFDEQTETIIKEVQVGGGGSSRTVYKNVTEYVEVDNYIDREVIKEIEVEKDSPGAKRNIPILAWSLVALELVYIIISTIKHRREEE